MNFLAAVPAYVVGSIPTGLLVARWARGVDVRDHGSGNIGAANVLRVVGPGWAFLVFILDAGKGLAPVLLGRHFDLAPAVLAAVALAAVAGHNWSVFLGFRGGKGVATSLGALLGLWPVAAAGVALVWILAVAVTRYASVGSLLGLAVSGPVLALGRAPWEYVGLGLALFVLAVYRHRANIKRLLTGKELAFFSRRSTSADRP